MITDLQKGPIEAVSEQPKNAVNFFSSYHRKQNIEREVKGGRGEYSCYWHYELLLGCTNYTTVMKHKFDLARDMDNKALAYISLVKDYQQFPSARVTYVKDKGAQCIGGLQVPLLSLCMQPIGM